MASGTRQRAELLQRVNQALPATKSQLQVAAVYHCAIEDGEYHEVSSAGEPALTPHILLPALLAVLCHPIR